MFGSGSFEDEFAKPLQQPKRRTTFFGWLMFVSANILLLPLVALIYVIVGAQGLREMMSIFETRLYRTPIPGAGILRQYDGLNRIDLAMCMGLLLFVIVSYIWVRVFLELRGVGHIAAQRTKNPAFFYCIVSIAAVILIGDAGLFYLGLASQTASGWFETPPYVPMAASVIYLAGLALLGAWHADQHHSPED